jgi:peptidoglycan/LPS O-acetylase OafA/YrhL
MTKQDDYLVQLDGLRFLAVGMVLVDHWMVEVNHLPFGSLGVNLFFVLSGFLITRILITSRAKTYGKPGGLGSYLKKFYIRRTLRIFPIYYLSIMALWLLNDPSVRGKLAWSLLYATNIYIAVYEKWLGVIDHFWSLAVEEQFYIFFPILIFLIPTRFLTRFFVIITIFSVLLRLYFFSIGKNWVVSYVTMFSCLDAFGLGAIMAYLMLFHKERFVSFFTNRWFLWVSLIVLVGVIWWGNVIMPPHDFVKVVWEPLFSAIFFFFLIGGAVVGYGGWFKWFLENPVSSYLGRISYGLYIYHNFIYNYYHTPITHPTLRAVRRINDVVPGFADSLVARWFFYFGLTVALASLSWYIIEKPINQLKDKFSR